MPLVIIINGQGGSGKDTFIEYCREHNRKIDNISTVDCVKNMAKLVGWNGGKNEVDRKFLSDIKDALTLWDNYPFKDVVQRTQNSDVDIVFIHCREPEEIQKLVNYFSPGSLAMLVDRGDKQEIGNHADDDVFNYRGYDCTIYNRGTLEDLKLTAKFFMKQIEENFFNSEGCSELS